MVKIRLRRIGQKKAPYYRIVVADSRVSMNSKMIEEIGTYDPLKNPAEIQLNEEAAKKWIANGAQPTPTVSNILKKAGVIK
ncbi:MAG: 30S ribosomal protein S16 [Lachnospiraceae bacterium]|nr:30S ribosomal protein S16 [Lachnospiraceae bacterium]